MISFLYGLAFFMVGVMISLMALGLAASILSLGFDQWSRRFFITMFSVLLLCSITVLIDCLVYGNPAMFLVEQIISYLESVSAVYRISDSQHRGRCTEKQDCRLCGGSLDRLLHSLGHRLLLSSVLLLFRPL